MLARGSHIQQTDFFCWPNLVESPSMKTRIIQGKISGKTPFQKHTKEKTAIEAAKDLLVLDTLNPKKTV
jgi:hypothetical protein